MGKVWRGRFARCSVVAVLAVTAAGALIFSSPPKASTTLPRKPVVELSPTDAPPPGTEVVEMFAAVGRGDLAVRLVPEKGQRARLELENRTDRPLTVQVPASFGARSILRRWVRRGAPIGRRRDGLDGGRWVGLVARLRRRYRLLLHSAGKGRMY